MINVETTQLGSIRKALDLEAHVSLTDIDGVEVLEIRDFVVSTGCYGRGYWMPVTSGSDFLRSIADVIDAVAR